MSSRSEPMGVAELGAASKRRAAPSALEAARMASSC